MGLDWQYAGEPRNLTFADVDARIRGFLQSQSATSSYAPKGTPWQAVDLPLVTDFPGNPQDRDEVNLLDTTARSVTRYIWVKSLNEWIQIPGGSTAGATGTIGWTAAAAAPTSAVLADGTSYLRADYPALFTSIGTTYGAADATHFNVPDLRNRMPIGAGSTYALAATGGAATHTLVTGELPAHTHGPSSASFALTNFVAQVAAGADFAAVNAASSATNSAGSGTAHNNLPPYFALNPFIWT